MKKHFSLTQPIKTALTAAILIVVAFNAPALAKKPKDETNVAQKFTLVEANAVSVTVSAGTAGETNKTFKIKDSTDIKIDGLPAPARDLKGGMVAEITLAPDKVTVLSINATDPKKPASVVKKGGKKAK